MNTLQQTILNALKTDGYCKLPNYAKENGKFEVLESLRVNFLNTIGTPFSWKINDENFLMVQDPFYTCRESLSLALDEQIAEVATAYLGQEVFLGTCNLRRSKITTAPPKTTNLFHLDENCGKGVRLVKIFYYLNDVDENGGPFEYIRGSHTNRQPGWENRIRWTDEEIYSFYGKENAIKLVANYGDLIIADTTGYHRGLQVRSQHRDMLTVNYVTRLELERCVISSEDYSDNPLLKETIKR